LQVRLLVLESQAFPHSGSGRGDGKPINPTNRCRAREQRLAHPQGFAAGEKP
jgi:hypothetical protein